MQGTLPNDCAVTEIVEGTRGTGEPLNVADTSKVNVWPASPLSAALRRTLHTLAYPVRVALVKKTVVVCVGSTVTTALRVWRLELTSAFDGMVATLVSR